MSERLPNPEENNIDADAKELLEMEERAKEEDDRELGEMKRIVEAMRSAENEDDEQKLFSEYVELCGKRAKRREDISAIKKVAEVKKAHGLE